MFLEKPPMTSLDRIQGLVRELQGELARLAARGAQAPAGVAAGGAADALALATAFLDPVQQGGEPELVRTVLGAVARLLGARAAYLAVHDEATGRLEAFVDPADPARRFERAARAVAERALEKKAALAIAELADDPRFADDAAAAVVGPVLGMPLPPGAEGAMRGAIAVGRDAGTPPFGEAEAELAAVLAAFLQVALPASRRLREQWDEALRFSMLNRLYESLARSLELDDVLDQVTAITLEVTGAERAFVLLKAADQLYFGAGRDRSGALTQQATRDISRTICRKVLETGQAQHVYDMGQDPELRARRSVVNLRIVSVAAVPLVGPDGVAGVLYIDARQAMLRDLGKTRESLEAVGRVASLAVESAKLYHQATVDPLTDLYVRSFFMLRLEEEVRRGRRYQRPFALLVMDIDRFKRINDTYGHQAGDEIIKHVATAVRRSIRAGVDLPGRYGGDEMMILLPETDAQGAVIVAERIRQLVGELSIAVPGADPIKVTASIGVAAYPGGGENGSQMFANADAALYKAKAEGRNRVQLYVEG
jgi:diguanylate cyclase (GGDEF)-like protein